MCKKTRPFQSTMSLKIYIQNFDITVKPMYNGQPYYKKVDVVQKVVVINRVYL